MLGKSWFPKLASNEMENSNLWTLFLTKYFLYEQCISRYCYEFDNFIFEALVVKRRSELCHFITSDGVHQPIHGVREKRSIPLPPLIPFQAVKSFLQEIEARGKKMWIMHDTRIKHAYFTTSGWKLLFTKCTSLLYKVGHVYYISHRYYESMK